MIGLKFEFQGELLLAMNGVEHEAVHLTSSSLRLPLMFLTHLFYISIGVIESVVIYLIW